MVGVSGGPDSVALLAALASLQDGRWRLGAAHVNHELRGAESKEDARFVARLAKSFDVPCFVVEGRVGPGGNLEERARERRYARLTEIARREGFNILATAHTADDQAETVLLRLLRGAGTAGLSGIAPQRADGILRPLLGCTRAEVLAFLRRRGLRYRNDRTNRSLRFTRNRIRRSLLPRLAREFNARIREALARTADLLREDEAYLEEAARRAAKRLTRGERLDGRRFGGLAAALQRRVVRRWLAERRGDLRAVGADHVERVRSLAASGSEGSRISLPGGIVSKSRGLLIWGEEARVEMGFRRTLVPGAIVEIAGWRIRCRSTRAATPRRKPSPWRAVFDAEALGDLRFGVRSPLPGDRIRPMGLGGSKKLQDVFVDAKVPRSERAGWPIVHGDDTILWVPGLVRAESGRVTSRTRRIVVIEARRT